MGENALRGSQLIDCYLSLNIADENSGGCELMPPACVYFGLFLGLSFSLSVFFSICCCCCCFLLQKNTVDMSCQSQEETGGREKKDCCHANASGGTMLQRRGEREKGRMERRKES